MYVSYSRDMWLPVETLSVPGSDVVGYVLSDGEWITILKHEPREVVRLPSEDVSARTLCDLGKDTPWLLVTIPDWVTRSSYGSPYDLCDR